MPLYFIFFLLYITFILFVNLFAENSRYKNSANIPVTNQTKNKNTEVIFSIFPASL